MSYRDRNFELKYSTLSFYSSGESYCERKVKDRNEIDHHDSEQSLEKCNHQPIQIFVFVLWTNVIKYEYL